MLDRLGTLLIDERRRIMNTRGFGLTALYNLVNDSGILGSADPDIQGLRAIHSELDEAVLASYGWLDIALKHGFHTYRQVERWSVCEEARTTILNRLLEENQRRAALEGESPKVSPRSGQHRRKTPSEGEVLF